jgi:hypothetical protein
MTSKSKRTHLRHTTAPRADTQSREKLQGSPDGGAQTRPLPKMPHERDESARATGNRLDERLPPTARNIEQAHDDIEKGLTDTDRRGVPDDVPSSRDNRAR